MMGNYEVIRELKGGSFSSTLVIQPVGCHTRVRKFISSKSNREYGLVRWQSQIRRMQHLHLILPHNTPPILSLGVEGDFFYYDIPFYERSQNLYEYLSDKGQSDAKKIFEALLSLMRAYESVSYGEIRGGFTVFFAEEVVGKLDEAGNGIAECLVAGSISKIEHDFALSRLETVRKLLQDIILQLGEVALAESLTHGNLTLENALYDHATDNIILIDPYGETYTDSVLGDLSQLMQSSVSKYEQIVSYGEEGIKDLFHVELTAQKTGVDFFGAYLEMHVSKMDHEKRELINLFRAAQFIRMFPFKIGKTPRLAIYFLLHGLNLIEEHKRDVNS